MNAVCDVTASMLSGLWCYVYDFQTLIVGMLAIMAAIFATLPVWGQLKQINFQSNTALRVLLLDRIQFTKGQRKWMSDRIRTFNQTDLAQLNVGSPFGQEAINSHQAHHLEQRTDILLDDIRRYRDDR